MTKKRTRSRLQGCNFDLRDRGGSDTLLDFRLKYNTFLTEPNVVWLSLIRNSSDSTFISPTRYLSRYKLSLPNYLINYQITELSRQKKSAFETIVSGIIAFTGENGTPCTYALVQFAKLRCFAEPYIKTRPSRYLQYKRRKLESNESAGKETAPLKINDMVTVVRDTEIFSIISLFRVFVEEGILVADDMFRKVLPSSVPERSTPVMDGSCSSLQILCNTTV
ncbi:hypothetical protein WN51_02545 [Melipona quadrifasciata]|uniref:Uncharacterized protein n=1 Tax=Melipona quadrifasciata TaxID=166423 RepID=A0A0M8ZVP3_9HYME|nr:hypothetical protein WN51_02545 [Melipona quadrifasciata]